VRVVFAAIGLVGLVGAACGRSDDPERRGDQAYGRGRYAEALEEYRTVLAGNPDPQVWAKAGAAALHTGNLREAADAYRRLAGGDPGRSAEAAEGLEAVVRAAERANDGGALRQAVEGLQATVPERAARYARVLAAQPGVEGPELVALLPAALATAPDPGTVDSLLLVYGRALRSTSGCGQALLQFRAVLRRSQHDGLRAAARGGVADCTFDLGEHAAEAGDEQGAALWFAEAARMDSTSPVGRRALLRYGEVRLRQGDTLAAALAFQTAVSAEAGESDSISRVAAARLRALGPAPSPGDSVHPEGP